MFKTYDPKRAAARPSLPGDVFFEDSLPEEALPEEDALPDDQLPDRPRKGRGAVTNRVGRFEKQDRVFTDDGWTSAQGKEERVASGPRTQLGVDAARRIITRNESPDLPFDRAINPYKGCEHGCVYCFARPTHAYLGLSPGLDFEQRVFWKPKGVDLLRQELAKPSYKCAPMAFGTNTDAYQPIERETKATRALLSVLKECRHPFTIVTKSVLVCRDLDIIGPEALENRARVALSITTLDRHLANKMEPRASTPEKRLEAIRRLTEAGIETSVLVAPVIPALNDAEMEEILAKAREAGAVTAGYLLLRLPLEVKDLFREWLEAHMPHKAARVLSLMRQAYNGALYTAAFGKRMYGEGAYATLIANRFRLAMRRLGYRSKLAPLDCAAFQPPRIDSPQLSLL